MQTCKKKNKTKNRILSVLFVPKQGQNKSNPNPEKPVVFVSKK